MSYKQIEFGKGVAYRVKDTNLKKELRSIFKTICDDYFFKKDLILFCFRWNNKPQCAVFNTHYFDICLLRLTFPHEYYDGSLFQVKINKKLTIEDAFVIANTNIENLPPTIRMLRPWADHTQIGSKGDHVSLRLSFSKDS